MTVRSAVSILAGAKRRYKALTLVVGLFWNREYKATRRGNEG
jgi:hypothetical protein